MHIHFTLAFVLMASMTLTVSARQRVPDIAQRIRVYWIGGPNKKWSVTAYVYINYISNN